MASFLFPLCLVIVVLSVRWWSSLSLVSLVCGILFFFFLVVFVLSVCPLESCLAACTDHHLDPRPMHAKYIFFVFFVHPSVPPQTAAEVYTLYPGERLELHCEPKEETKVVSWTKDGVPVLDGEHVHLRKTENLQDGQLEIEGVEPADSGLYSCFASGPYGNQSSYFFVNITGM